MPDRNIPDELWRYFGKEPPGTPKSNVVPINGHSLDALNFDNDDDDDRRRSYALAALLKECDTVACTPPNTARNHNLNAAKFNLARFINEGILSNAEVDADLTSAARAAGLPDREIEQCLRGDRHQNDSAAKRGNKPAVPPAATYGHVFEVDPGTLQPVTSDNGAEPQDATDYFARTVRQRALQIRIDDEARELYNDWQASALGQTIPDIINLHDFLAVPDIDAQYRINDLWPTGGNVLLAAQYKAGKTSLVANLLRSLADGQPFLGKFGTTPPQRITLFDDELDERMLRRWLRDQGIRNQSAITLASMKGRLATFNILNARSRARWAELLRGSDVLILDCLRPCLDALGLDEHRDAGRFLGAWDALKKEADISESIIVHHMGHGQERSRGDSRLLDWPDVNWKIVKESRSEGDQDDVSAFGDRRFFSALGRDVNVSEGMLQWEPENRALTYLEGGRGEAKAVDAIDIIRIILRDPENREGLGTVALTRKLQDENVGKTIGRRAIKRAIDSGIVVETDGPRNARILTLNPSEA